MDAWGIKQILVGDVPSGHLGRYFLKANARIEFFLLSSLFSWF
jgi:hypothetical protein